MIVDAQLDLSAPASVTDAILLSLNVRKGSFWQRPSFGSELHLLAREKEIEVVAGKAKFMVERALQWLVILGRIADLHVVVDLEQRILKIKITASTNDSAVQMTVFTSLDPTPAGVSL